MEFPTLGEHCQFENCNRTDFLPIQCKCGKVFCREHFLEHCLSGNCELAPEPREVNFKSDDKIYKCSVKGCRKGNLHEMLCLKCKKHYCIEHRFHASCPEIDDETKAAKNELYGAPMRLFKEANKHLQDKITENIRKALQSTAKVKTAAQIHLMRVKQKAIGPKTVPVADRVYFAISKPKSIEAKPIKIIKNIDHLVPIETVALEPDLKDVVPVFVSSKWSLGRAIDSICEYCKISNNNNKTGTTKLRLFRQLDGYCIGPVKMDIGINELITKEVLIEGDRLIMEHVEEAILNDLHETAQLFLI